ncbi:Mitochondrial metalloendopeptidase OMA1 [Hypsizygus marmoreus]|uniref:Mitochondrial metalloendopeptidase OMA1 n=1 Tax=Hypsizygus marmoreus TaxID=39966 RepID=A0A369JHS4_HYPMA|nr:Mitochondrial metalloendopeptidase OMA1 [Hypsizygus marmoreus]
MFRAQKLLRESTHIPRLPHCRNASPRYFIQRQPCTSTRNFSSSNSRFTEQRYVRFEGSSKSRPSGIRDRRLKIAGGIAVVTGIYYVYHLEQVPETGRWRFMNTGPQFEETFGKLAREQSLIEYKGSILPAQHPLSRHVRRVVARILTSSNLGVIRGDTGPLSAVHVSPVPFAAEEVAWNPDAQYGNTTAGPEKEWDVIVVNDSKMINAQAVPGLIIVYTGILPVCQDEQGLSAVLSHEIGHVVARHTAERLSSQTVVLALVILLQTLGLGFNTSNILQKMVFELPNSRTQELEADKIGLKLMARACYDPRAAPEMFRRLGQVEAKFVSRLNPDFLRTHPSSEVRVQNLEKALSESYAILAANPACAAQHENLQAFRDVALKQHSRFGREGSDDFLS